jgi:thiol:disulfide interchange protein DsbC
MTVLTLLTPLLGPLTASAMEAATLTAGAPAAAKEVGELSDVTLRAKLAERLGGVAEDYRLRWLPELSLFEVYSETNARIAYVDREVRHVFVGTLFDAVDKRNLTQLREQALNRIPLDSLPAAQRIRIVKGRGNLHFAAFEDPDCPYCRAMEAQLDQLDDYTLDVLLLPLNDLHPKAEAAATAIWCAEQPAAAWRLYMHEQTLPEARECATPIAALRELAHRHRVTGTPTLVMPDGQIVEGMPDLDALKTRLAMPDSAKKGGDDAR